MKSTAKTSGKAATKKEVNACSGKKMSKKVTEEEIESAIDRMNPDENSMESRG